MRSPEEALEVCFERVGGCVGRNKICAMTSILISTLIVAILGIGFLRLIENESRPDAQWIPAGAPALAQNKYINDTWNSNARFNSYIATCKTASGAACNMLSALMVKEMHRITEEIQNIVVTGAEVKAAAEKDYARDYSATPELFDHYNQGSGRWSFRGAAGTEKKCFQLGPLFCGQRSLVDVFGSNANFASLDDDGSLRAINFYNLEQKVPCPMDTTNPFNPCANALEWKPGADPLACQKYGQNPYRSDCRAAAVAYCNDATKGGGGGNDPGCVAIVNGSVPMGAMVPMFDVTSILGNPRYLPDGVNIAGAESVSGYFMLNRDNIWLPNVGNYEDPLSNLWERKALCVMGIDTEAAPGKARESAACPGSQYIKFDANFARSFGDEGGSTIQRDLINFFIACAIIVVYLVFALSERDPVHSMIGMACVTLLVCGAAYVSAMGLGAYLNKICGVTLKNSQLNSIILFLLLGLGVDDAFVLCSEFNRACQENPKATVSRRIALTARHGGMSILITSATDALAFLIGSATVLPALSWFCLFAGLSVIFCFFFQVFIFLPCLALNAWRAEAVTNEAEVDGAQLGCCATQCYDCLCCVSVGSGEGNRHMRGQPHGWCSLCCKWRGNCLSTAMRRWARAIVTPAGRIITVLIFAALLATGIVGMTRLYKNFKIEWFIPSDSYVADYFATNDAQFQRGTPISIYTSDFDYFKHQAQMHSMASFLNSTELIDQTEGVDSWYQQFQTYANGQDYKARNGMLNTNRYSLTWPAQRSADGIFLDRTEFWRALHEWFADGGVRYASNLQWADARCSNRTLVPAEQAGKCAALISSGRIANMNSCTVMLAECTNPETSPAGFTSPLIAARMTAVIAQAATSSGQKRYDSMIALRAGVRAGFPQKAHVSTERTSCGETSSTDIIDGAFPFTTQFLFWEEMGVIDTELIRNLIICCAVIVVMILCFIPRPRIAIVVIIGIIMSIVDVVGILSFWDVQINGVATIYILISVGLAVDYSAHIAHMFKTSKGKASERVEEALVRIGPSVFNAMMSTFLAVCVMAFSQSYVFLIFFKALFLVTAIAGAHGLWLLPVMLATLGGDNGHAPAPTDADGNGDAASKGVVVVPASGGRDDSPRSSTDTDSSGNKGGEGKPITANPNPSDVANAPAQDHQQVEIAT